MADLQITLVVPHTDLLDRESLLVEVQLTNVSGGVVSVPSPRSSAPQPLEYLFFAPDADEDAEELLSVSAAEYQDWQMEGNSIPGFPEMTEELDPGASVSIEDDLTEYAFRGIPQGQYRLVARYDHQGLLDSQPVAISIGPPDVGLLHSIFCPTDWVLATSFTQQAAGDDAVLYHRETFSEEPHNGMFYRQLPLPDAADVAHLTQAVRVDPETDGRWIAWARGRQLHLGQSFGEAFNDDLAPVDLDLEPLVVAQPGFALTDDVALFAVAGHQGQPDKGALQLVLADGDKGWTTPILDLGTGAPLALRGRCELDEEPDEDADDAPPPDDEPVDDDGVFTSAPPMEAHSTSEDAFELSDQTAVDLTPLDTEADGDAGFEDAATMEVDPFELGDQTVIDTSPLEWEATDGGEEDGDAGLDPAEGDAGVGTPRLQLVWAVWREGATRIYLWTLAPDGVPLDPAPQCIYEKDLPLAALELHPLGNQRQGAVHALFGPDAEGLMTYLLLPLVVGAPLEEWLFAPPGTPGNPVNQWAIAPATEGSFPVLAGAGQQIYWARVRGGEPSWSAFEHPASGAVPTHLHLLKEEPTPFWAGWIVPGVGLQYVALPGEPRVVDPELEDAAEDDDDEPDEWFDEELDGEGFDEADLDD